MGRTVAAGVGLFDTILFLFCFPLPLPLSFSCAPNRPALCQPASEEGAIRWGVPRVAAWVSLFDELLRCSPGSCSTHWG